MRIEKNIAVILFILFLNSCIPFPGVPEQNVPDSSDGIYVLNSLSGSVSVYQSANEKRYSNAFFAGNAPNAFESSENYLFTVNSLENSVTVTSKSDFSNIYTIETGSGTNPWDILINKEKKVFYVSCFLSSEILIYSLTDFGLLKRLKLNTSFASEGRSCGAEGLILHGASLYVCCTNFDRNSMTFGRPFTVRIDTDSFAADYFFLDEFESSINSKLKNVQSGISFESNGEIHFICTGENGKDDGAVVIFSPALEKIAGVIETGASPAGSERGYNETADIVYLVSEAGILAYSPGDGITSASPAAVICGSGDALLPEGVGSSDFLSDVIYSESENCLYAVNFSAGTLLQLDSNRQTLFKSVEFKQGVISAYEL